MPKRIATPPPSEDEPKYLTIVHPYPAHANMALQNDQFDFVFWLAACTGKKPLQAFFHKPSSHGMVILEIDRDFQGFDRLLGAHAWSGFLKNPSAEESGMVSKIFFCSYKSGREVEKYGWKRVYIRNEWFEREWPENLVDMEHYPRTTYCDVPKETTQSLCRPLPARWFPPPPKLVVPSVGSAQRHDAKAKGTPPVGSAQWLEAKAASAFPALVSNSQSKTSGAWANGGPKSKSSQPPAISLTVPRSAIASPNPWNRGAPDTKPPTPALSTTSTRSYGSASASPISTDALPGLQVHVPVPVYPEQKSTWGNDKGKDKSKEVIRASVKRWADKVEDNLPDAPSRGNNISSTAALRTAEAFADLCLGDGDDNLGLPNANNVGAQMDDNLWADSPTDNDAPAQNLWSNYFEESSINSPKKTCRVHGIVCNKGICSEYAMQLKEAAEKRRRGAGRNKMHGNVSGVGRGGYGQDVNARKPPTRVSPVPPATRPPSNNADKGPAQAQDPLANPWGTNPNATKTTAVLDTQKPITTNPPGGARNTTANKPAASSTWSAVVKGPAAKTWPALNVKPSAPIKKSLPLRKPSTKTAVPVEKTVVVGSSGGCDDGWGDGSEVW